MQGTLEQIPIENCMADDTFNTRQKGLGDLTELTASIEAIGITEPLLGKNKGNSKGEVEIYAGFRRLAAARSLGLPTVPVVVVKRRGITRQLMLISNITENLHRKDLNPVDEALALQRLQVEHKMSVDDISAQLGLKVKHIQNRFRLLKFEGCIRDAVHDERISVNSAIEIDRLPVVKQAKYTELAYELHGGKLKILVDKELDKIQRSIELQEASKNSQKSEPGGKTVPTAPASSTENAKLISKSVAVVCEGLGYYKDATVEMQSVNFKLLEQDDLQVVAKFFDALADQVEEDVGFNEKAKAEITSYVESGGEGFQMMYDVESPTFRSAIVQAVSGRATEIAREAAQESGRRAKVTYAFARQALDEFFCPYELSSAEPEGESAPVDSAAVQA